MIKVICDMPDHVIGITAKGKVTGADYSVEENCCGFRHRLDPMGYKNLWG
jgi:hypothetical protein